MSGLAPGAVVLNQVIDECQSTNDLARSLGQAGAPHGSWISARRQVAGRGRMGRAWSSIEGNLFLSLVLRVEDKKVWTWVPIAVAVGVAKYLRSRDFDVRIKWPNDLWLDGGKLSGILCEAVGSKSGSFIVAGLGLNCREAPEVAGQKTACLSASRPGTTADVVREPVIKSILEAIRSLETSGPDRLALDFESMTEFPIGSQVSWEGHPEPARVDGLGPSGELRVTTVQGEPLRLYAEEIRAVRKAGGGSPA